MMLFVFPRTRARSFSLVVLVLLCFLFQHGQINSWSALATTDDDPATVFENTHFTTASLRRSPNQCERSQCLYELKPSIEENTYGYNKILCREHIPGLFRKEQPCPPANDGTNAEQQCTDCSFTETYETSGVTDPNQARQRFENALIKCYCEKVWPVVVAKYGEKCDSLHFCENRAECYRSCSAYLHPTECPLPRCEWTQIGFQVGASGSAGTTDSAGGAAPASAARTINSQNLAGAASTSSTARSAIPKYACRENPKYNPEKHPEIGFDFGNEPTAPIAPQNNNMHKLASVSASHGTQHDKFSDRDLEMNYREFEEFIMPKPMIPNSGVVSAASSASQATAGTPNNTPGSSSAFSTSIRGIPMIEFFDSVETLFLKLDRNYNGVLTFEELEIGLAAERARLEYLYDASIGVFGGQGQAAAASNEDGSFEEVDAAGVAFLRELEVDFETRTVNAYEAPSILTPSNTASSLSRGKVSDAESQGRRKARQLQVERVLQAAEERLLAGTVQKKKAATMNSSAAAPAATSESDDSTSSQSKIINHHRLLQRLQYQHQDLQPFDCAVSNAFYCSLKQNCVHDCHRDCGWKAVNDRNTQQCLPANPENCEKARQGHFCPNLNKCFFNCRKDCPLEPIADYKGNTCREPWWTEIKSGGSSKNVTSTTGAAAPANIKAATAEELLAPGVCRYRRKTGQACLQDQDCLYGLRRCVLISPFTQPGGQLPLLFEDDSESQKKFPVVYPIEKGPVGVCAPLQPYNELHRCKHHLDCPHVGYYCPPDMTGLDGFYLRYCRKQLSVNSKCQFDFECEELTLCNKAEHLSIGKCRRLFSLPLGHTSSDKDLCQSGYMNQNFVCAVSPKSKRAGRGCERDQDCTSTDPFEVNIFKAISEQAGSRGSSASTQGKTFHQPHRGASTCQCRNWWSDSKRQSRYCTSTEGDIPRDARRDWLYFQHTKCGKFWSEKECLQTFGTQAKILYYRYKCLKTVLSVAEPGGVAMKLADKKFDVLQQDTCLPEEVRRTYGGYWVSDRFGRTGQMKLVKYAERFPQLRDEVREDDPCGVLQDLGYGNMAEIAVENASTSVR
ncbi:unnamed protein product [Amoebophrya sp. A120]|nr:unnamed protein product [Amoebophrya sp. A120]|eukprot:GSA120T00008819001.1